MVKGKNKSSETRLKVWYWGILAVLVVAVVVLGTVYVQRTSTNNEAEVGNGADNGGEVDYSVLSAVDSQAVIDFIAEKKTGFLYAGRPTCPHCQVFAPILTGVVKEKGLTVFYYDTDAANANAEKKKEALGVIGVTGVPSFMYIEDGVIVERLENVSSEAALLEFVGSH